MTITAPPKDEIISKFPGSEPLLNFYNELSDAEKSKLFHQISTLNLSEAHQWFIDSADQRAPSTAEDLKPVLDSQHFVQAELHQVILDGLWNKGMDAIGRGEVCAIVLAGGQATRLGSSQPKGTIPLGINASFGDSLLGIQAAKIALLQALAGEREHQNPGKIHWAVMTSPGTEEATREHVKKLAAHHGFDFDEQITIFSQDEIAAYDEQGNFLLGTKGSVVAAPNGNGGLYSAISAHLPRLRAKGIKYFHVYCVDNILCKVADPHFIGFAISNEADVATKCVPKQKGELVGSVCLDRGLPRVVEYSELGAELAEQKTPDGKYLFGAGSIANHFFTMDFMDRVCSPSSRLPYHRAHKKISYVNEQGTIVKPEKPNGIKLEQFIFDVFELSKRFFIWEVARNEEFSPLKNAQSVGTDCLSTCQRDLSNVNKLWLERVQAKVTATEKPIYLKTIVSYNGENLQELRHREISDSALESDHSINKFFVV
ncbi:putative UDP-N-acetylglucosamine pyrophosphorylase [Caenorhabditis elegans]|uniref:Probable UDP-N-acetylglucosamine pyrophosphorylase n=1 Tax=Caenorhabditis elegans TaxID=6239 RepID=UAP1_CAEEL|nr:putative UDP-N-acetylglucosamine pyrophosphorylase [Caenorhabditis elegans]Q18493.2 RecName: Full=Probable UDP-N-acetylglucosamine pyrophosphorylase [Caenorhabditis elegans]CAA91270.2 Probable UDP-N-acetylglucosamine pyrophosphorylase [Caenorhabditis elegans]|eukprot:NP_497777.1 Probable UDP-N-acetylglucosamine pyrophosphorylase [Caenorhabditis elegans]